MAGPGISPVSEEKAGHSGDCEPQHARSNKLCYRSENCFEPNGHLQQAYITVWMESEENLDFPFSKRILWRMEWRSRVSPRSMAVPLDAVQVGASQLSLGFKGRHYPALESPR